MRSGRMTAGQQRAFDENWERWGLDADAGRLDLQQAFQRKAPVTLEIGFGMGQSLVQMAKSDPARDFIGIEVHKPGVGRLLHSMADEQVHNIRVYCHDAVEVLRECIDNSALDRVQVFFPDPWHKKRHNKRRLIQPAFVDQLADKIADGGELHLATDWEHYAEQMMEVLTASPRYSNRSGAGQYAPRPDSRPLTKFEQRGERLGHGVWDLIFVKER